MTIPRYGFFARFKDGVRGWRDGTRHRPGVNTVADVRPAGYWNRLRQLPAAYYAEIDKAALQVSGDLITRMRQLKHDVDLFQVEVADQQQRAKDAHDAGADPRQMYKRDARLGGRRRQLLDVLHEFEECQTRAEALEQRAQVTKHTAYEYANERFSVYIGKLINYHRRGDLIQSAINDSYVTLGPLPPTQSIFAALAAPREQGPPPVGPDGE